jgi:hypothetical protein
MEQQTKYRHLNDEEVQKVIDEELNLDIRERTWREWWRMLLNKPVEYLPPKTLETQLEAIEKLGSSRNALALQKLIELKRTYTLESEAKGYYNEIPNHCDGGSSTFIEWVETEHAYKEIIHPAAKDKLDSEYRHRVGQGPSADYNRIENIIDASIRRLKSDLGIESMIEE